MDFSSLQASGLGTATHNGSSFSLIGLYIGDAEKMHVWAYSWSPVHCSEHQECASLYAVIPG